jgi:hypothetical protein
VGENLREIISRKLLEMFAENECYSKVLKLIYYVLALYSNTILIGNAPIFKILGIKQCKIIKLL